MRKSRQKLLLDIVKKNFTGTRTKRLVDKLYKTYNEGFYVNAKRDLTNIKRASKYIGRYLARLAIAEYRIAEYDGKTVTFWYENEKAKKKVTVTIDVLEFIGKLTQHIYLKGFRVVRRYRLYVRVKNRLIIEIYGANPFKSTNCGNDMILWQVWHHKYGVI